MKLSKFNRKLHYWGAIVCALPVLITIVSGMLLMLKKEISWIQPVTNEGVAKYPDLEFSKILSIVKQVKVADINTWKDIKKIDVRPSKGIMKVVGINSQEIQLDSITGRILQVKKRNSDLIESIHNGGFFHKHAKLWLFFPASIVLFILWLTGIYLFVLPLLARNKNYKQKHKKD